MGEPWVTGRAGRIPCIAVRQLWAPWRMAYVSGQQGAPEGCFLCHAADPDGDAPNVVDRHRDTVTVLNRFPYSSGHLMVAPRRHEPELAGLSEAEGTQVFVAVRRAVLALRSSLRPEGFNIGVNQGLVAGASIEHVHVHVVPRWGGDTNFMPSIGDVKVIPEQLERTAEQLRQAYAGLAATG